MRMWGTDMWGRPQSLPIDQGRQRSGQGSRRVRAVHSSGTIPDSGRFTHLSQYVVASTICSASVHANVVRQEPPMLLPPVVRHREQPGRQ
jgi:hypothetical protein